MLIKNRELCKSCAQIRFYCFRKLFLMPRLSWTECHGLTLAKDWLVRKSLLSFIIPSCTTDCLFNKTISRACLDKMLKAKIKGGVERILCGYLHNVNYASESFQRFIGANIITWKTIV